MLSDQGVWRGEALLFGVLILVLMEYALWLIDNAAIAHAAKVS